MLKERKFLSILVLLGLLAGCSGGGGSGIPGAAEQPAAAAKSSAPQAYLLGPLQRATAPTPIPANISETQLKALLHQQPSSVKRVSLITSVHSADFFEHMLGTRKTTLAKFPDTTFQGNTTQQVGYHINPGYDDMSANLTAYTNVSSISLSPPDQNCLNPGFGCINNIATNFHPGTNGGTGNCLETGTGFYRLNGQSYTTSVFWVGDFCNLSGTGGLEAFNVQEQIDGNFQQLYIANLGDGLPRITIELLQPLSDPNTSDWYAFIYDYYYQRWEQAYETNGNFDFSAIAGASSNPYIGWSLDEYRFENSVAQPCPQVPTASANGIQVGDESSGNDANNYFRPMNSNDYQIEGPIGGCFVNNGAPTGYIYNFSTYDDQWGYPAWQVTDPAPAPSPPLNTPNPCAKDPRLCE